MDRVKKILTTILVVAINYYLLTFITGLFLMLITVIAGPINMWITISATGISLLICILYQINRKKYKFNTIGELIISNINKNNILEQNKLFKITRIPLFILLLFTLVINGNLQDGLSEGKIYSFGNIIFFVLMFFCIYSGLKNFFIKSDILPILLISGGLLLIGIAFKYSPKAVYTGDLMFKIYCSLSFSWLIVGLIYNKMSKKNGYYNIN
jgi:hypothetical protein